MAIDFRENVSDPYAVDLGNKTIQKMTVSKTIKFGMFTMNDNAVWGAIHQLQKESFPFAEISFTVNRNAFRYEIGDVFKWSYSRYGITDMICRVLLIEEQSLESENIIVHAMQDVFAATNAVTVFTNPTDNSITADDYSIVPFVDYDVMEVPYFLGGSLGIIPVASKESPLDIGFYVYMSIDGGTSYSLVGSSTNLQPYGTLRDDYGITYTVDETMSFIIDFESGGDSIESVTWPDVYSGNRNIAFLGDEIISFKDITPISASAYKIDNIIRGRYGTQKVEHSAGENFWFISKGIGSFYNSNIVVGANVKFKFVPYNVKVSGNISDAEVIDFTVSGESKKPYETPNFNAEGESFNPLYTSGDDITLTWTPTHRGKGCGMGIPGVPVITDEDYEGLYRIEVWVSATKVRDVTDIDALTWDYTNTMNVADNTTPANEIEFRLYNYIIESGFTYECDVVSVTCYKE